MKKNNHLHKRMLALILILVLTIGIAPSAFAAEFKAYVKSDTMKVYGKKSLSSYLGKLSKYTVVTVEDYSDGVARIRLNGNVGYAKVADMAATQEATVNTNTLVYRTASTASMSLSVKKGTQVNLVAINGTWAMVEREGVTAYMKAANLTINETKEEENENQNSLTNAKDAYFNQTTYVYWKKSTSGSKVKVTKGMTVKLLAVEDGWATVYNPENGLTAYAKSSTVTTGTPQAESTQTPSGLLADAKDATITKDTYVYWQPSTSAGKVKVKKGQSVKLLGISGVWAMVYNAENGTIAYINASQLKVAEAEVTPTPTPSPTPTIAPVPSATVTPTATAGQEEDREELLANAKDATIKEKTYVYWQPSTSAEKVSVAKGLKVKLLKIEGDWALVYNPAYGVYAYINPSKLQVTETTPAPTATPEATQNPEDLLANAKDAVITANTKVYWKPSLSASSVKVSKGLKVKLVSVDGTWALVYNPAYGVYAYINASQVSVVEATATPTPTQNPEELLANAKDAVITENTIVYKSPDPDYPMTKVSKGLKVKLVAVQGNWALVYNPAYGVFAYMNASQVKTLEELATPTPDPLAGYVSEVFGATVIVSGAKFYETASTSAESVDVKLGTNVTVGAYNISANWAYVDISGRKGFIQISALSRDEYSSLGLGSTGSAVSKLESQLLALGYFDGVPGTTYSTYTRDAVSRFQSACGLSTSGLADEALQRILYGSAAPSASLLSKSFAKGDSGSDVERVQLRLFALGYLSKTTSVDGDYGTKTANAVKLFQDANGISMTGTLDNTTLRKLYSTSAISLPAGKTPGDLATVITPEAGNQQNNSTTISDGLKSVTSSYSSSMSAAEKLEYAIYCGQNQLGKPYVYGSTGMNSFDCSGFTYYAFKQIGVTLPRTAYNQGYSSSYTKIESIGNLKRGDLVFFDTVADSDACDHVGIYLGAGYFIHASSGQGRVVVSNLVSGYYNTVFSWGRRILA